MERLETIDIELACMRLVNSFAVLNDAGQFRELAALFTENARYARPIAPDIFIEGRADILASFETRPKDRIGRHLITNLIIDVESGTRASGFCYVTLYSGSTGHKAEKFGLQAQASQFIGEYRDSFVLTAEGWKFAERRGSIIFTT